MLNRSSFQETRRPAAPHIDINSLRPDPKVNAVSMAAGLIAIALGFLPVQFAGLVAGTYEWTYYHRAGLAGLVAVALGLFAVGLYALASPFVREWVFWRWARDAHEQAIRNQQVNGGAELTTVADNFTLRWNDPLAMLGLAIAVHYEQQRGKRNAHAVDELTDSGGWLGQTRLGKVPQSQAEQAGRVFAALRFVEGRKPRQRGEWAVDDYGQIVEAFAREWSKIKWAEVG